MDNTVLVTRPYAQGQVFIDCLKERKIHGLAFPCIEIKPVKLDHRLKEKFSTLNRYNYIIFISANAVWQALEILQKINISTSSIQAKIVTIGKASAQAANRAGFEVDLSPDKGFNSEALLALPDFAADKIAEKSCLIIRGVGGRNKLAEELTFRGAELSYAEIYRREKPTVDKGLSRQQLAEHWADLNIKVITATSNESIQNFYDMLNGANNKAMLKTSLVVASQRGVKLAKSLGFKKIKLAASAINQHMLESVESEIKETQ